MRSLLITVPAATKSNNFGSRVTAFIIDFLLLEIIHFTLLGLLAVKLLGGTLADPSFIPAVISFYLVVFFIGFLLLHMMYFTLFHAILGQTIGKMIMGIRVVTFENRIATPAVSFLRWSGYLLSFIPLGTGFLWAAVDKDQSAWHDKLAGTRVVSVEMT